ncbi:DoxX family protein [Candidatus Woesearchaeota archaeon]|nr:DoxX family protein [Candidatus Woesearchaeota archaeon]
MLAGAGKLFGVFGGPGIEGFSGMLAGIGFPAAGLLAYLVGTVELVGGILLVIGLWTTVPAALLATIMAVAIVTVHRSQGWGGIRFPLLLLAVMVRYIGTAGYCSMLSCVTPKRKRR